MAAKTTTATPDPAAGKHWTDKYRLRLGVGDSPVEMCPPFGPWKPPTPGVFKINYSIHMPHIDPNTNNFADEPAGFAALARSSTGDIRGLASGTMKFRSKMGMQLYALRAAAKLVKELRERRLHDGPVVYESNCVLVSIYLDKRSSFVRGEDPEEQLRGEMPEDLESVDGRCAIRVGEPDEVMAGNPELKAAVDKDKKDAGLM